MYKFALFIVCIAFASCDTSVKNQSKKVAYNNANFSTSTKLLKDPVTYFSTLNTDPYAVFIDIIEVGKNDFNLIIKMDLNTDSFYVSPNSVRDFSGKFKLHLNENNQLEKTAALIEKPLSTEIFDPHPFVDAKVNWVKDDTTYTQKLHLNSKEDFQIRGLVQFIIEPNCTLEKIPFTIVYADAKMKIVMDDNC